MSIFLLLKKVVLGFSILLFSFVNLIAQQPDPLQTIDYEAQDRWVDSLMQNMSVRQKIGQLFMVDVYSNGDKNHIKKIEALIDDNEIGGLIFFQGTPIKQARLTNEFQTKSKIPLLIAIDGEWGLNMRLDSTYRYPWNMTLGAIRDTKLIEDLGKRIGEQHRRLGIHINFAPVVDINTNPKNPIIGNRSYGENKFNVTEKAIAFVKGMQQEKVLACGKHFPGHGDTDMDSHKILPSVLFDAKRIDSVELYPYKKLFENQLGSVMTAHLSIPSLEKNKKIPASISENVVTHILKEKMGFNGLIFTDALNMKGATNFKKPGKIDLAAFLAGNDVLLFSENTTKAIILFEKAYKKGKITQERLDYSVRKILKAKYWAGLNHFKEVELSNLYEDLNKVDDDILYRKLVNNSITLIKKTKVFPIVNLEQKIAYLKMGDADNTPFVEMLKNYTKFDMLDITSSKLKEDVNNYDLVIVGFHKSNINPWKSYRFSEKELVLLQDIAKTNKIILAIFTSPYSLLQIDEFSTIEGIVVGYQNSKVVQELTAQKIFGAIETKGKLPVSIGESFSEGYGLFSHNLNRLSYGIPEEVGMSSQALEVLDTVADYVLQKGMSPSMQVLVARYGKVIFHRAYGHFTMDKKQLVKKSDLYDLASITKILGALPLIMKAEEERKFDLDDTMGQHLPILKGTNKDSISIRKALAHFAQLKAWIPYYTSTLDSVTKKPLPLYYRSKKSTDFAIKITNELYLRSDYQDSIYQRIADSELREKSGYKYSGLIFYLVKDFLQKNYNQEMDVLDENKFYKPLGANTLTYKPLNKFSKNRIVPTEIDNYFRHQLLQGTVHDMGAAMMDGVSGNAGLFGSANDIAKMMQMYLQGGFYGGKRYFKSKTIDKFNTRYYEKDSVRRGLGFDKPQLNPEILATCGCVSEKSFGHSGFTGTYAWVDPETELLYIFLSNRVYPNMSNTKLVVENIRTKTQQIVVDAIVK